MQPALGRLLHNHPTPIHAIHDTPPQPHPDGPDCICRTLDAIGQNPHCPAHPWWRHDPTVLNLADHPDGPWTAALNTYGEAP